MSQIFRRSQITFWLPVIALFSIVKITLTDKGGRGRRLGELQKI